MLSRTRQSHKRLSQSNIRFISNYATKIELKHTKDVYTSDLAAKKDFIVLKAEVNKLDINKLTNVWISLDNVRPKQDDLDVHKLKTIHGDLKKLSDLVNNQVVKNRKFNTLK